MSALELVMMKRIGELHAEVKLLKATVDRFKAENERLRKARDDVAFHIGNHEESQLNPKPPTS